MRIACKFDWFPGPEYQQGGERIFFLVTKVVIRDEIEKF